MKSIDRLRRSVARRAFALAERFDDGTHIKLDYKTSSVNLPRYGYGRPRHEGLARILDRHVTTYASELNSFLPYRDALLAIPLRQARPMDAFWLNSWLLGLDIVSLYCYIWARRPRKYIEVGSGISTMVVARAKHDGNLSTEIISIDPSPRADIDVLCQQVIRRPLEQVDANFFADVDSSDLLFVDGSHRIFMNSDMTAFYLDVLPALPHGLLVGIHDILWPEDYLPDWSDYYFSEQYLFAAYLLAECAWIKPVLACNYCSLEPQLKETLAPLWDAPDMMEVDPRGFAFWLTIAR